MGQINLAFKRLSLAFFIGVTEKLPCILLTLHKKRSFPLRISPVNAIKSADLVTFTGEILNGKRHFLCSVNFLL